SGSEGNASGARDGKALGGCVTRGGAADIARGGAEIEPGGAGNIERGGAADIARGGAEIEPGGAGNIERGGAADIERGTSVLTVLRTSFQSSAAVFWRRSGARATARARARSTCDGSLSP